MNIDKPISLREQSELMKKYIVIDDEAELEEILAYTGYFRLSRYGKYLLSQSNIIKSKPRQDLLFDAYNFDVKLRSLFFKYTKKAEIQFKSHLSNAISLKTGDAVFYLDKNNYTPSKGERDKIRKKINQSIFEKRFDENIKKPEELLRQSENKYPELKEYRSGGSRSSKKIPSWAAFSYFEMGVIASIYSFLKGDLRKEVLIYGYSKSNYGKEVTKQMDTWLDAIRNLRNVCAHHNKLIGKTSSIVLAASGEEKILVTNTDLFSRMYALKKILCPGDAQQFMMDIDELIKESKVGVYMFGILPSDWRERYEKIEVL